MHAFSRGQHAKFRDHASLPTCAHGHRPAKLQPANAPVVSTKFRLQANSSFSIRGSILVGVLVLLLGASFQRHNGTTDEWLFANADTFTAGSVFRRRFNDGTFRIIRRYSHSGRKGLVSTSTPLGILSRCELRTNHTARDKLFSLSAEGRLFSCFIFLRETRRRKWKAGDKRR